MPQYPSTITARIVVRAHSRSLRSPPCSRTTSQLVPPCNLALARARHWHRTPVSSGATQGTASGGKRSRHAVVWHAREPPRPLGKSDCFTRSPSTASGSPVLPAKGAGIPPQGTEARCYLAFPSRLSAGQPQQGAVAHPECARARPPEAVFAVHAGVCTARDCVHGKRFSLSSCGKRGRIQFQHESPGNVFKLP